MATVNPYLYFNGNCEEAFDFYRSVFKTEFAYIGRYKDVPEKERGIFADQDDKPLHISLSLSKETIFLKI